MLKVEAKSAEATNEGGSGNSTDDKPGLPSSKSTVSSDSVQPAADGSKEAKKNDGELLPFEWMVKPCHFYKEEYSDCKSIKARFNQYFVFGEAQECSSWNEDFRNCTKWETDKDVEALQTLIESEKGRVRTRLRNHYANDVWENREKPPEDWNKELPLAIQQGYEASFLKRKNEEIKNPCESKDEEVGLLKNLDLSCTIM